MQIMQIIIEIIQFQLMHQAQQKVIFQKFSQDDWNSIEQEVSPFLLKVCNVMSTFGKGNYDPNRIWAQDECAIGQEFYIETVRPQLTKGDILPKVGKAKKEEKKKGGGKKQKSIKYDEMRKKISTDRLRKDIAYMLQSFSFDKLNIQVGLQMKKIQLKLVTFLYICIFFARNQNRMQIKIQQVFELIFILSKVIRLVDGMQKEAFFDDTKEIEVSPSCVKDLKQCMGALTKHYDYSISEVLVQHPKLIYHTSYDRFFEALSIKPYKNQKEVMDIVQKNMRLNNSFLLFYRAMIGAGKTTLALAISHSMDKDSRIIYCCTVSSVRSQLAKLAYNSEIKFAIGALGKIRFAHMVKNKDKYKREYKEVNDKMEEYLVSISDEKEKDNWMREWRQDERPPYFAREVKHNYVKDSEQATLVIADIFTTCELLRKEKSENKSTSKTLLFFDEPTAYIEQNSDATLKFYEIINNYTPKYTILVSATMPEAHLLPKTINIISKGIEKQYKDKLIIQTVRSKEFQVGCQFCSFDGHLFYPHSVANDGAELKRVISILKENPFLLRLYTGPSMLALLKRCEEAGLKGLPNLEDQFDINQQKVLEFSFQILDQVVNLPKDQLKSICEPIKLYVDEEQDQSKRKGYVRLKRLCLSDVYKFTGGCLIGVENPLVFVEKYFKEWTSDIPSIKRIIDWYKKDKAQLQAKLESLQKSENAQLMGQQKKQIRKAEIIDEFNLQMKFPVHKKLNTPSHFEQFGRKKYHPNFSKGISVELNLPEVEGEAEDWIIQLLLCGVGIYSQYQGFSIKYLNMVEMLASQGSIVYLITDRSLCFGTNFPISNVILLDTLADTLTLSEIFQLIGRAGRVGQSWMARAFLQQHTLKRMENYIKEDVEGSQQEGIIFERVGQRIQKGYDFNGLDHKILSPHGIQLFRGYN